MTTLREYVRSLADRGPLAVVAGHYTWPGRPTEHARVSLQDTLEAVDSTRGAAKTYVFLDDIGASASCTTAGCAVGAGPRRVGQVVIPEIERWLAEKLAPIEQRVVRGDSLEEDASELRALLSRHRVEGGERVEGAAARLLAGPVGAAAAPWLEDLEVLAYALGRASFRPLLLARELRRDLPEVLLERSMSNATSRTLHKLKKSGARTALRVTEIDGRAVYLVDRPNGSPIEVRHEAIGDEARSANKCAGILSQLFFTCCRALRGSTREAPLHVLYVVPCHDRTRLNDGMWAFGQLYLDLERWFGSRRAHLATAFYCGADGAELLCDEWIFGDTPRSSTLALRVRPAKAPASAPRVVYADNNATTPVDALVLNAVVSSMTAAHGNPSSAHALGWRAEIEIAAAAREVAALICADADEVFFTSGATESNNWWLTRFSPDEAPAIVTSPLEHKSVLEPVGQAQGGGRRTVFLGTSPDGHPDLDELEQLSLPPGSVVSLMMVNNEVHTVLDAERVGRICAERGYVFHTDAAQAIGRVPVDVHAMKIAAMSISGHKIHAPKGIGALFVSRAHQHQLRALMVGGGQQRGLRAGTLPTPLIVGLGRACAIAREVLVDEIDRLNTMSRAVLAALDEQAVGYRLLGPRDLRRRRPGGLSLIIEGLDATRLCDRAPQLIVSQGSACNSRGVGSHVLRHLGLDIAQAKSVVRVAFGRSNTLADAQTVGQLLARLALDDRRASAAGAATQPLVPRVAVAATSVN